MAPKLKKLANLNIGKVYRIGLPRTTIPRFYVNEIQIIGIDGIGDGETQTCTNPSEARREWFRGSVFLVGEVICPPKGMHHPERKLVPYDAIISIARVYVPQSVNTREGVRRYFVAEQETYPKKKKPTPGGIHTRADWRNIKNFWHHRCAVPRCHGTDIHKDHVVPSAFPTKNTNNVTNIQPLCARHNLEKNCKLDWPLQRAIDAEKLRRFAQYKKCVLGPAHQNQALAREIIKWSRIHAG